MTELRKRNLYVSKPPKYKHELTCNLVRTASIAQLSSQNRKANLFGRKSGLFQLVNVKFVGFVFLALSEKHLLCYIT